MPNTDSEIIFFFCFCLHGLTGLLLLRLQNVPKYSVPHFFVNVRRPNNARIKHSRTDIYFLLYYINSISITSNGFFISHARPIFHTKKV